MYVRDLDKLLCYDVRQDRSRPFAPGPGAPAHPATATVPVTTAATTRPNARDAVFVPTPHDVADRMLALAGVKKDDIVYDLGSGDGRILIAAAKTYGCHAVGYEVDPQLVRESREEIDRQQLGSLVTVEPADLFTADLSKASVVTLYVGRDVNRRLVPQLEKLKRGSRIVSNSFEIEGYAPDKTLDVKSSEDDTVHTLYLWVAPLKKKP